MTKKSTNTLLAALQFVASVQPKRSAIAAEMFCRLFANKLVATAGPLSAGINIQEEIECCPNTQKLIEALKQCPDAINLTMLTNNELSVRSGNFQAIIPCIKQHELPAIYPNAQTHPVTVEFEQALKQVGSIVSDKAKTILQSSVQLLDGSIVGSNGEVIFEAWHGCPGPQGPILPKLFITAIKKRKGKSLYFLGVATNSLTAYYDDGSWIKTAIQSDPAFPDLRSFLSLNSNPGPTPLGFFEAIERLEPFSQDRRLYFTSEGICTDNYKTDGAINLCDDLPVGISFNIESIQLLNGIAEKIDFNVSDRMAYFFGRNIRGAIGCKRI
jgi:hypothetical protein